MISKHVTKIIIILALVMSSHAFSETIKPTLDFTSVKELNFNIDGIVQTALVKAGTVVKKNQILAELNSQIIKLKIKQSEAELTAAQADFDEEKRANERALELFDREVLSQVDMDKSNIAFIKSQSNLVQKKTKLGILLQEKNYHQIIAPYDAIILENTLYQGKLVRNQYMVGTAIKLAAINQAQFLQEAKSTKKVPKKIKVTINNKQYDATLLASHIKGALSRHIYQVSAPHIYRLVGKKITTIRK